MSANQQQQQISTSPHSSAGISPEFLRQVSSYRALLQEPTNNNWIMQALHSATLPYNNQLQQQQLHTPPAASLQQTIDFNYSDDEDQETADTTKGKPSYEELYEFYAKWKDVVPFCMCKEVTYDYRDFIDKKSPKYSAAHPVYVNIANVALDRYKIGIGMENVKNTYYKKKAVNWIMQTLKISAKQHPDASTELSKKLSSILAGKRYSEKEQKEADSEGVSVYQYRQNRKRRRQEEANQNQTFTDEQRDIIEQAVQELAEQEPIEQELIEQERSSLLLQSYPPKISKGQYVAVAWNTRLGLAEVTEDLDEGEDRKVDLIEIKTKANELMFNWKRKTYGDVESKYILGVVQKDNNNQITNIAELESHYEAYFDKYFAEPPKDSSEE
ncbi:moesin/ezrin/radixin homolog 1-like [Clytia hemisphaerica]|uniref:moesin/ezrin/radixin homolog 1-like n=1 Tax=Clytia hemisphaerica TaxID=252671 RepID=UPI0034D5599E